MKSRLKIVIFASALLLALAAPSCGGGVVEVPDGAVPYTAVSEIYRQFGETAFSGGKLLYSEAESPDDRIEEYNAPLYFGDGTEEIDLSIIDSYAVIVPPAAGATQAGVIKVKASDEASAKIAAGWVEAHLKKTARDFASYLPEQEKIADSAVIKISGRFVYYCAADGGGAILEVLERTLAA